MQDLTFSKLQRSTLDESNAQISQVSRTASHFSLRELINSRLQHPLWQVNQRAIEASQELSEGCRQRTGVAPNGTWVPFAALTRDLTASGNTGAITGTIGSKLQSALAVESAVMGGATILSGLSGSQFSLPGFATSIDASTAWVNEGQPGPQLEPSFKTSVLTPKSLVFMLGVSRQLLANSTVDLETELRAEILRRCMAEIDRTALKGTGGAEPSGLLNHADLQVLAAGANGAAPAWAHLVEAEYQVGTRVTSARAPSFLVSPTLRKKLRTTQRAAGLDFILSETASSLMGHRLSATPHMPDNGTKGTSVGNCSSLLFGDLSEVYVGFWGPLAVDILIDGTTQAKDGRIRIIAHCEVGVTVRNIGAFAAYKDLLSA